MKRPALDQAALERTAGHSAQGRLGIERAEPLKRQPPLSSSVSEIIMKGLIDGSLKPGDRLVEKDIADLLGVSRSPIREALSELAQLGVTLREPGRGSQIREWSRRDLEELFAMRIMLEGFAAERAAQAISPSDRKAFERIIARMRSAAERGNYLAMIELDMQFHQLMWRLSDNKLLCQTLEGLSHQFRLFLALNWRFHGGLDKVADNHQRLLDALVSGDREILTEAIREHVVVERMTAAYAEHAELSRAGG